LESFVDVNQFSSLPVDNP